MEIEESGGKKILLILAVVLAAAVLAVVALQFINKAPVTAETFIAAVEDRGLQWEENIAAFTPEDQKLLEEGIYAYADGWQVEFYQLASERAASSYFSSITDAFDGQVRTPSSHASVSAFGYASYALTASNGSYYYAACIDRTVIIATADKSYKEYAREIVKVLGY